MLLPPHLHHSDLCPPPPPLLSLLGSSLISRPAGLLLDGSAEADWCGGGASTEVGGAGGGGAVVLSEGPCETHVVRSPAPANRHVGREGERRKLKFASRAEY